MMQKTKVGVMQPYLFPYIGYFQLIQSVDAFVFYDDVNFIKQGWVNRNNILINNNASLFTVPLEKLSSNLLINEININEKLYKNWLKKFLKSLIQAYSKSPHFNDVYPRIESVFQSKDRTASQLAISSIRLVTDYLNLQKTYFISSKDFAESKGMDRADRLIYITKKLKANKYINVYGGSELYEKDYFLKNGIELSFLKPELIYYQQFKAPFCSGLSIIDVLMFNDIEKIRKELLNYTLV